MEKITFVIPSRNNLEFLKLSYKSIRDLDTIHEILILDDASTDGTHEWIQSLDDKNLIIYHNPGPERIGIVGMFDKGIIMATTDIIFAFHADMIAAPNLDVNIIKHLKPGTVVSATRIEPPLHPPGPEKITLSWGDDVDEYDYNECRKKFLEFELIHKNKTTNGIFAPWCMYKKDYLDIGGHDDLFAPQSKEDSDLFNRFVLNGYEVIQSWDGLVYHFTSRGSRFNKHSGGKPGQNSQEWEIQNLKSARNFIRKWGHFVCHDDLLKPIIPPKYNIGFKINNCSINLLHALEPWCTVVYVGDNKLIEHYITDEQKNTKMDLKKRVHSLDYSNPLEYHDVVVEIDGYRFSKIDFDYIQHLSQILQANNPDRGSFELNNLKITVLQLEEYQNQLIKL